MVNTGDKYETPFRFANLIRYIDSKNVLHNNSVFHVSIVLLA